MTRNSQMLYSWHQVDINDKLVTGSQKPPHHLMVRHMKSGSEPSKREMRETDYIRAGVKAFCLEPRSRSTFWSMHIVAP